MAGDSSDKDYAKPPTFMTDKQSFRQYKRDVLRWVRCTSVPKKRQADIIILNIPATHPLKERIEDDIGETVIENENGVQLILDTLESVYGSDEVMEVYLRFRELETKQRTVASGKMSWTILTSGRVVTSEPRTKVSSCRRTSRLSNF